MLFVFLPMAVLLLALPSLIAEANLPMRTATQLYGHDSENVIDVMVVGSGLCGSTAAFYLKKNGSNVFLADSRDVVGGNVITNRADVFQWEEGPNSFQPSSTILRFVKDLGLLDELVLADGSLPRYVYWDKQLIALPGSLKEMPGFKLLSWRAKLRATIGLLGFIKRRPSTEETVKEFFVRHLGLEVFERIIDPFVSGVYAGDPNKLSITAALSKISNLEELGFGRGIIGGAFARAKQLKAERKRMAERDADLPKLPAGSLGNFKSGMQTVPRKVQELLGDRVLLSHKLVKVARENSLWVSTFETPEGVKVVRSKALVMTAPGYTTADLLSTSLDGQAPVLPAAAELNTINYPPVASVTVAYPTESFKIKPIGFGHLIPRAMNVRTLGTIWASSLFPGRAPEGFAVLTNFIGGAQDPRVTELSPAELVQQVHTDALTVVLKPDAAPPRLLSVKMWPKAIPQYNLGHTALLARIDSALTCTPGLYLGGNYKTGVAIGDCIQFGVDTSSKVCDYIKTV